MRLSRKELTALLLDKVTREDYTKLAPLIENAQLLNASYNKKDSEQYAVIDACIQRLSSLATNGDSEEALVNSIQALCEHLSYGLHYNPLMHRQAFIMDKMRAAGYRISGIGECYGLSHMAIQAFFAGQLTVFYTRLQRIYDMPIEDFIDDFSGLKEKRRQLLDSGDTTEAQHVNDLIVELRAFFDSTALTNRPDRYLHDEDNLPLSSKQLFHKTYPFTQSIVLEEPGKSITVQANFSGAYTKAGLQRYLELFTKHASEIPFALNIICNMHAMSLMYDPDTTRWVFCDPNHLPPQEFQSAQVLADAIFARIKDLFLENLIKDSTLVMGTEITTAAEYAEDFGEKFGALKQDEAWIKLHKDQDSFVDYFNLSPNQLYENYYGENKLDLAASDKIILELGMQQKIASVVIDYALYYGIDTFINRQNSKLVWVLSILPQDLQQQLWEKLSDSSKINVIQSSYYSATQLQLFQSLPERYKFTIFQQLDVSIQAACLTAVTWEERLAVFTQHTLKDKGVFLSQLNSTHFNSLFNTFSKADKTAVFDHLTPASQCKALLHESPQERQRIWHTLPESQQHAILSTGNDEDVAELVFFLVDTDQDKAFLACDANRQGHILVALNKPEQLAIRHKLLKKLSLEQQANILSIGPDNVFTYANYKYLLSFQFFKLLPIEQRLGVFLALSTEAQNNFLYALRIENPDNIPDDAHLSGTDLIEMRDDLIKQLPLSAKQVMLNASRYTNDDLYQTFTADERQDILHDLPPATQHAMLTSLIKAHELHLASTLIQSLSFEQKLDIFKSEMHHFKSEMHHAKKSDVLLMLFESMSDKEQLTALATEIPNQYGATIDYFLRRSSLEFLRQSLNSFSINTRFNCLRKNIYDYEALSLNELKAIIQDKIDLTIAQRTKHRTVFDGIRIDIARAQEVCDLDELLEELDKLFDFEPTEALDTFDTTALAPLDEQQVSHRENLLTLDEILYKLTINRSQLTSLALKRVWLSIHPDKTTTDQAEFSATRRYIQSLQVCLSMNNLVPLHSTPDIEALINEVLSGITSEDEQFLLEKAAHTLGNLSNHSDTSPEFIEAAVRFIETNLASHQQQKQSFTTTLKALSKAASALAHIEERRVFKKDAARYQQEVTHTLATKTAPSSVIATGMGIFLKCPPSGTNKSKLDSEGSKKPAI